VWQKVTDGAVARLPHVDHASITVLDDRPTAVGRAATDRHADALDQVAQCYLQSPGIDAARRQEPQHIDDLHGDHGWPTYAANAAATPVRSIAAYPLYHHETGCGALNLYADTTEAFAGDAGRLAEMFACSAAVAIESAQRERRMAHLLTNRDLVGQAKGLLMERFGIDAVAAFAMLTQLAERERQPLPAVARKLLRRSSDPAVRRV
jgi:GAF domain-containing protein